MFFILQPCTFFVSPEFNVNFITSVGATFIFAIFKFVKVCCWFTYILGLYRVFFVLHFLFCFVVYLVKSGRTVGPFYISKGTGTGPACTGVDLWFVFFYQSRRSTRKQQKMIFCLAKLGK